VKQEQVIADELKASKMKSEPNKEIIALIAYLKRMGTDIKGNKTVEK
jgi:cytochrome c oxidase cbb3-type subunit I/II